MSLHALAAGTLIADPQKREGKSVFAIGTLRVQLDQGESALVSLIAFGDEAGQLLDYGKGDALAVSGRAKLTEWTGRDGEERHGLSIVVSQLASVRPHRRSDNAAPRHRGAYPQRPPATRADAASMHDDSIDLWAR